ncbi:Mediator complex subunit Med9 [Penicillium maclennaniae]|uniref:Mediator complex subunit Med9 n=1 Tax=Penicillium maclennaniae TaxID=1343394 RepID=UPI0025420069|nr:Mediator complex subunit Med9 [Penicillium maclennaniae]KAJ5683943.1 Mediator complex subunit Med9 [Penicillium maclennaniae]
MASRSPPVATPLPKSSVAPESPRDATASQPKPFPSPTTFEIIPPLHGILSRLLIQKPLSTQPGDATGEANGALGASGDAPSQGQQAPTSMPGCGINETGVSQAAADVPILNPKASGHLDTKDLPTATSSVKIRIQKARGVVEELPDVHRSVEEQENEIEELEDRVTRLRSIISDFGSRAAAT